MYSFSNFKNKFNINIDLTNGIYIKIVDINIFSIYQTQITKTSCYPLFDDINQLYDFIILNFNKNPENISFSYQMDKLNITIDFKLFDLINKNITIQLSEVKGQDVDKQIDYLKLENQISVLRNELDIYKNLELDKKKKEENKILFLTYQDFDYNGIQFDASSNNVYGKKYCSSSFSGNGPFSLRNFPTIRKYCFDYENKIIKFQNPKSIIKVAFALPNKINYDQNRKLDYVFDDLMIENVIKITNPKMLQELHLLKNINELVIYNADFNYKYESGDFTDVRFEIIQGNEILFNNLLNLHTLKITCRKINKLMYLNIKKLCVHILSPDVYVPSLDNLETLITFGKNIRLTDFNDVNFMPKLKNIILDVNDKKSDVIQMCKERNIKLDFADYSKIDMFSL